MKPTVPCWIARCTFGWVPNDVSITIRTPGTWRRNSPVAVIPSRTGILMSTRATSGRPASAASTAARPSPASAATTMPAADSSTVRMPALTRGSSSAISTLIISVHSQQDGGREDHEQQDARGEAEGIHAGSLPGSRWQGSRWQGGGHGGVQPEQPAGQIVAEEAAGAAQPSGQAREAGAGGVRAAIRRVDDRDQERACLPRDRDADGPAGGVPDRVREPLLDDAVGRLAGLRRERPWRAARPH